MPGMRISDVPICNPNKPVLPVLTLMSCISGYSSDGNVRQVSTDNNNVVPISKPRTHEGKGEIINSVDPRTNDRPFGLQGTPVVKGGNTCTSIKPALFTASPDDASRR